MIRPPARRQHRRPRRRELPVRAWRALVAWPGRVRRMPPRRRLAWLGLLVLLVVALALLRRPMSQWLWPDTRPQQLRSAAAQALAAGRLSSPDGRGARELYEAALALDPDRGDARAGLSRVALAAVEQARRAIDGRRFADAERALALARELHAPRAAVEPVADALRRQRAAQVAVEPLLQAAAAARAAGRLAGADDPDSALALYQRVLAVRPDEVRALEGREDVLADLLQQARRELAAGRLARAGALIDRVVAADSGHVDLPDALAARAQATDARRRRAAADLRRGRLLRAEAGYRELLAVDASDADAAAGLDRVADAYAARSERAAAEFQLPQARIALERAQAIAPDAPAVRAAREHLARARLNRGRALAPALTPARERRLEQLLHAAARAEERGDLVTPPGDSAFDHVRAARALAPRDARVRRATARLLPAAERCFEQGLQANRLVRAGACLDAWATLGGGGGSLTDARRRLAARWIAVGNERLGAGELPAAQAALAAARGLDPDASGLADLAGRIAAAASVRQP